MTSLQAGKVKFGMKKIAGGGAETLKSVAGKIRRHTASVEHAMEHAIGNVAHSVVSVVKHKKSSKKDSSKPDSSSGRPDSREYVEVFSESAVATEVDNFDKV